MLSRSDFTNQLASVLNGLILELVESMGNVQAIFYQETIPEKQRLFLRFLWWNEGIFASKIINHKTRVGLFGAVSSHSSNNYTLRKTATDNSICYNNNAAEAIMKTPFARRTFSNQLKMKNMVKV